ncbi:MAG: Lrp/AsnC ligand binding domain-containing protein [Pseudomonadota bacterium]
MKTYAYVLVSTEPRKHTETYNHLCDIPGVKSAHQTTGRYDVILWCEANDASAMSKMVIDKVRGVDGIRRTETLFAFDRSN